MWGDGRVCPWVESEGWLRWFAHPFGGVECRGHVPAFTPDTLLLLLALQKWQLLVVFFVFCFCLFVHNLPQLHMHAVIFSPL